MKPYENPALSPRERAEDLLSRMGLDEKFAQTLSIWMSDGGVIPTDVIPESRKAQMAFGIGTISTLDMRRMTSHEQLVQVQHMFQRYAMEHSEHHIPAAFHMEGLCGAFLQGAASFPCGLARGASFDPELEETLGGIVARQERCFGITHTLAPVLDINRDARLGRLGETYGEDPTLAAAMGAAFTRGVQGGETVGLHSDAVAKHFLGFHNSEGGIHGAASNTPRRLLTEIYGKPFQAAITESGLKGVMPCYCAFDGEPAAVSGELLTGLLRDEMGFDGVTVADYGAISNAHSVQGLFESFTDAGLQALRAGMDMEWPQQECFSDELKERFRRGEVPMELLDRAVLRVLTAKFRMGLFERPCALEGEELRKHFFQPGDAEATLRSARESLVLLKNDGVLPLSEKPRKIAVIGPHGNNPRSFFGGYTHMSMAEGTLAAVNSLAGVGDRGGSKAAVRMIPGTQIQSDETPEFDALRKQIIPNVPSLYEALKRALPETEVVYAYGYPVAGNDTSRYAEALEAMQGADVCILTLGGKHGSCSVASMGEGVDAANINLPPCQDGFLELAAKTGIPLVGVHLDGRPISSDTADRVLGAILECWSPAEGGAEAIADVLTGNYNPSGKLPVSVAYHTGQLPLYYNHPNGSSWHQGASIGFQNYVDLPHTPRYRFGYGLSYTTFAYSELRIEGAELPADGAAEIRLTLTNTGTRAGTEVVQLYVRDRTASMVRPNMELAGFRRVTLEPGEAREVSFTLHASQLAFLDREYRWTVEAGAVDVMVGSSSAELPLRGEVRITEAKRIDGKHRAFRA